MDLGRTDAMLDALAFVIAHANGDTEAAAMIAAAADPASLAGALATLVEGVVTFQGSDPAQWAARLQQDFLAHCVAVSPGESRDGH